MLFSFIYKVSCLNFSFKKGIYFMKNIFKKFLCAVMVAVSCVFAGTVANAEPIKVTVHLIDKGEYLDYDELPKDGAEWYIWYQGSWLRLMPISLWTPAPVGDEYICYAMLDVSNVTEAINFLTSANEINLQSRERTEDGCEDCCVINPTDLAGAFCCHKCCWDATISLYGASTPIHTVIRKCPGAPTRAPAAPRSQSSTTGAGLTAFWGTATTPLNASSAAFTANVVENWGSPSTPLNARLAALGSTPLGSSYVASAASVVGSWNPPSTPLK